MIEENKRINNKKKRRKDRLKRKISIFTIMLWVILITTMTAFIINVTNKSNALENVDKTITLKIDFSEYLINESMEYNDFYLENYASDIILAENNIINDEFDYLLENEINYIRSENDYIGIYEIKIPETVKYIVLDYYNSTINKYYNLVSSNINTEEIIIDDEVYHGLKIKDDLEEYNIKLVEKERESVRIKIDFSEYLTNENIVDEYEINQFFHDQRHEFIALNENIINRPSDYTIDLYNKYRENKEYKIGIYDVELPSGAKYISLKSYNTDYNIVSQNNFLVEEIKDKYNEKVYSGIKVENGVEEYNLKLVEKEKRTVRIKVDFEEYLRDKNIEEDQIEETFRSFRKEFIAINNDVINESYDYNLDLFNKYMGSEENKIGIYDVEVPNGAKYIALNLNSIYFNILSNDYEIVKIKNNYNISDEEYYAIKIEEPFEECNIKILEKEKRTIRVKIDFSEYLESENIESKDEIDEVLKDYEDGFFMSNTDIIEDGDSKKYYDLIYKYIGFENDSIGVYDISTLKEFDLKYLVVSKETINLSKYYITNDSDLIQYIYDSDIYYGVKIEDNIDEYNLKLKRNDAKTLILDISKVNDLIDFEEFCINLEINNCIFSNAEFIEANDNFAIFNIYVPKGVDSNIVFDEKYKVFENDVELENYKNKYFKVIKSNVTNDSYNFKLGKRYVELNLKINGIDNITQKIDEKFKNLNIEVRNRDNEVIDKLYFLSNSSNTYKYISNKLYNELKEGNLYIELENLEEYSIVEYYEKAFDEEEESYFDFYAYNNMTYNNYNIEKNIWEHKEDIYSEVNYTINYKNNVEDEKNEKTIEFSKMLEVDIPKELYENIIIFHKGGKWTFDKVEDQKYIYKVRTTDCPYDTDEYDIYIPKILDNNIKAKLENDQYLSTNNDILYNNSYIVLGNKIESSDNIILQSSDENARIYKNIDFIDNKHARLNFSYIAFSCIGKYMNTALYEDKYYNSYISENSNGMNNFSFGNGIGGFSKSFILFKENLPKDFKVSDEYINNNEWVFLDDVTDEEYYLPDCTTNGLSLNKDVMNKFIEKLNLDKLSGRGFVYTDKKYVYVKSTNTLYYLVDIIKMNGSKNINLEYIGNDDIEKEYIVNNNIDAYYVVLEKYINGEASSYFKSYINKYNLTEVEVEKRWEDNDNINNVRPDSIIAELKKNGETVKEKRLSNLNSWKGKIYYVPEYEYKIVKNEDGENIVDERKIEYTIDEKVVSPYYEKKVEGNVITNKYIDKGEYINLNVDKKWIDENNKYNMRPSSIIVQIYDKDKLVAEEIVSEESDWKCSFKLPKYDEKGKEIKYRVDEKERNVNELKNYDKKIEGNSIINTLTYKEKVDTSDINMWMYAFMFIVAFIATLLIIFITIKSNRE